MCVGGSTLACLCGMPGTWTLSPPQTVCCSSTLCAKRTRNARSKTARSLAVVFARPRHRAFFWTKTPHPPQGSFLLPGLLQMSTSLTWDFARILQEAEMNGDIGGRMRWPMAANGGYVPLFFIQFGWVCHGTFTRQLFSKFGRARRFSGRHTQHVVLVLRCNGFLLGLLVAHPWSSKTSHWWRIDLTAAMFNT